MVGKTHTRANRLIILLFFPMLMMPAALLAGQTEEPKSQDGFVLGVSEGLISLVAHDAVLREVVEEMGRQLGIEVAAQISREERITVEFTQLSIEEAINKLVEFTSLAYRTESMGEKQKITKLILVSASEEPLSSASRESGVESTQGESEQAERPEPFKFQFDPSQMKEKESDPPGNNR